MVKVMSKICYYGVATNDLKKEYKSKGLRTSSCPINRKWRDMIRRCYDEKRKSRLGKLSDCSVCAEWLLFSNFKAWMEKQDWQGKELNKDIMSGQSKIYSPETCLFVDRSVNMLVVGLNTAKGAVYVASRKKYYSSVKNTLTGKLEFLGLYKEEHEANHAYKKRKSEIILEFAKSLNDKVIASYLVENHCNESPV